MNSFRQVEQNTSTIRDEEGVFGEFNSHCEEKQRKVVANLPENVSKNS